MKSDQIGTTNQIEGFKSARTSRVRTSLTFGGLALAVFFISLNGNATQKWRLCAEPDVDLHRHNASCERRPGHHAANCPPNSVIWSCNEGTRIPCATRFPMASSNGSSCTAGRTNRPEPFVASMGQNGCPIAGQVRINGGCVCQANFRLDAAAGICRPDSPSASANPASGNSASGSSSSLDPVLRDLSGVTYRVQQLRVTESDPNSPRFGMIDKLLCIQPALSNPRNRVYTYPSELTSQCTGAGDLVIIHPTTCHSTLNDRARGSLIACRERAYPAPAARTNFLEQVDRYRRTMYPSGVGDPAIGTR